VYARLIASGKCADVYLLLPDNAKGGARYLEERGVRIIRSQASGTPEWLINNLLMKLRKGNLKQEAAPIA
jgi:hypothetical protein